MKKSGTLEPEEETLIVDFLFANKCRETGTQLGMILNGWNAYYEAEYDKALNHFTTALPLTEGWDSWSLLGIGKVASDWLDWKKSSGFICHALKIARDSNDLVRMTECYGALGEVAFRSGSYKLAYELFLKENYHVFI